MIVLNPNYKSRDQIETTNTENDSTQANDVGDQT